MPEYRVYLIDRHDHIVGRKEFVLPDNEQAVEKAKQFVDGRAVELWSGSNLIARIPPKGLFSSGEFLGVNDPTRSKKCRELAAQAEANAANEADPEKKAVYMALSRQWNTLADTIEAGNGNARPPR
jgi:hypothetical protein